MIAKVKMTESDQNSWFGFYPKSAMLGLNLRKSLDKNISLSENFSSSQCV